MNIGRSFSFVFDDEDWLVKILIGGVVALAGILTLGILFLPLLGAVLVTMRNVIDGKEDPMPSWNDFGGLFTKGFFVFVISLGYSLIPAALIGCMFILPFGLIGGAAGAGGEDAAGAAAGISLLLLICLIPLAIVVGLAFQLIIYAALIRYAETDSVGAAFEFGTVWGMLRNNLNPILLAFVVNLIMGFIISLASSVVLLGPFAIAYAQYGLGHALGQAALEIRKKQGLATGGNAGADMF
jgi:hypothetical protein